MMRLILLFQEMGPQPHGATFPQVHHATALLLVAVEVLTSKVLGGTQLGPSFISPSKNIRSVDYAFFIIDVSWSIYAVNPITHHLVASSIQL